MKGKSAAELFPWARFDPAIPTLQSVVGFDHGARPLRHAEMQAYLRALDDASPRAAEPNRYASAISAWAASCAMTRSFASGDMSA